jgi:hypothetical protein
VSHHFAEAKDLREHRGFGCVAVVDVAGFTRITSELAKVSNGAGAEHIAEAIACYFRSLLK